LDETPLTLALEDKPNLAIAAALRKCGATDFGRLSKEKIDAFLKWEELEKARAREKALELKMELKKELNTASEVIPQSNKTVIKEQALPSVSIGVYRSDRPKK